MAPALGRTLTNRATVLCQQQLCNSRMQGRVQLHKGIKINGLATNLICCNRYGVAYTVTNALSFWLAWLPY